MLQNVLTNLQNVGPGNVATLQIPAGPGSPTYDQIKLVLSGGMLASHITSIRAKANGRIFHDDLTGSDVQTRDLYRGITNEAGFVVLDFTEPRARNGAAEQLLSSIPAHLLSSFVVEIGISGTAPVGGRIRALGVFRPPTNNPNIRKQFIRTEAITAAFAAGAPYVMQLPTGKAGGKTKRLWIKESAAGVVTALEVRTANNVLIDATRAELENDQKRNGLAPQAGWLVADFISDGNLAGWLPLDAMPATELRLVTSGAVTVTVIHEMVDPIGNL